MSYFLNLEIIDNKMFFFANLDEHSKDSYFTVKGFQIKKLFNLVELFDKSENTENAKINSLKPERILYTNR